MGGRGSGRASEIMRALCVVIRPDHFKFASYGPDMYIYLPLSSSPGMTINYFCYDAKGGSKT